MATEINTTAKSIQFPKDGKLKIMHITDTHLDHDNIDMSLYLIEWACKKEMPDVAWDLIEVASRPLTIIYDDVRYLAPSLAAEDGSAAIRVTSEPFSRELCMRLKRPLVSTSANISGEASPRCFADINPDLLKAVDYVCTSRREEGENPAASSIIKLKSNGEIVIVRE